MVALCEVDLIILSRYVSRGGERSKAGSRVVLYVT